MYRGRCFLISVFSRSRASSSVRVTIVSIVPVGRAARPRSWRPRLPPRSRRRSASSGSGPSRRRGACPCRRGRGKRPGNRADSPAGARRPRRQFNAVGKARPALRIASGMMTLPCRCTSVRTATHRWSPALRCAPTADGSSSAGRPASTRASGLSPRSPARPSGRRRPPLCSSSSPDSRAPATGYEAARARRPRPSSRRRAAACRPRPDRPDHALQRGDPLQHPLRPAARGRRRLDAGLQRRPGQHGDVPQHGLHERARAEDRPSAGLGGSGRGGGADVRPEVPGAGDDEESRRKPTSRSRRRRPTRNPRPSTLDFRLGRSPAPSSRGSRRAAPRPSQSPAPSPRAFICFSRSAMRRRIESPSGSSTRGRSIGTS